MLKPKFFFRSLKQTLKLRVIQPWYWNNIPASILPNIHSEVTFWYIIRKPLLLIIPYFLPKTWASLEHLFESSSLAARQLVGFCYSHRFWWWGKERGEGQGEEKRHESGDGEEWVERVFIMGGEGEESGDERHVGQRIDQVCFDCEWVQWQTGCSPIGLILPCCLL